MYPIANIQLLWKGCTVDKVRSPIEWFSWVLEQAMIDTAAQYTIPTHRFKTGVWADKYGTQRARKMGAIGLQLGNWVSMHGAGFNVCTDLSFFDHIIMCELPGESATSVHNEIDLRHIAVAKPSLCHVANQLFANTVSSLSQPPGYLAETARTPVDLSSEAKWEEALCDSCGFTEA